MHVCVLAQNKILILGLDLFCDSFKILICLEITQS
jgi:hypothetical protein